MAWNMIMRVIKTPEDESKFVEHLIKINALFVSYFVEVYQSAQMKQASLAERASISPFAAVTIALETATATA